MTINKNYIVWTAVLVPILIGSLLIVKSGIIRPRETVDKVETKKEFFSEAPSIVKAVYLTSPSGGSEKKIDWLIDLAQKSELNAVVIDIKDYSGYVSYDSGVSQAKEYNTERITIKDVDSLIKRLHENNIYTIARITVFQDPVLAKARPDWAVKNKYTNGTWYDRNGLAWINPLATASWDYFAALAKDAGEKGFDEINFDYIRFPSDGNLDAIVFPGWDGQTPKSEIIGRFFLYLRKSLPDKRLSADMFGFVTTHTDDLGIGQLMEKAFAAFDYISPMVYPSHYPPTYLGFANPAEHPYDIVNFSMKGGIERLKTYKLEHPENKTQFRPWLQDFDLGAVYTPDMVRAQIKADQDALGEDYRGFMLWNARNVYTDSVFQP